MQFPLTPQGTLDIQALFAKNRAIYGDARMEGEGGDGGDGGDKGGGKVYTPPATQEDLDRLINRATAKAHGRYADYDDLKAKAEKHDALELELGTAADKAAATARQEERAKASSDFAPKLVRSEFKAAAAGRIEADRLTELLEDLDLSKYVDDKGDVDEDKVAKKVAAWAPTPDKGKPRTPNLGQGNREQSHEPAGSRGLAEAEKRFGKK